MRWNWQHPEWPEFRYDPQAIGAAEQRFLQGSGVIIGVMQHLADDARRALTIELMSQETVDSSAIEGDVLDRASVQSSIAKHLGFAGDHRRPRAAEAGAAEVMVDLYRTYADPLTVDQLFAWHAMLMNGRRDIADVGRWRAHEDPMQIVSGAIHAPRVHFEAPPSAAVPGEMQRFLTWFNVTGHARTPRPLSAIARAAVAHLWFESVHPFEDANGRIGRAVAEKALAQGLGAPALTALAETILRHRKAYYEALRRASEDLDIDAWLAWFAGVALEAQTRTLSRVQFVIDKTRWLDRLRGRINPRQEKALMRLFAEGVDGFKGGLSAENYRTITGAAGATATRDLADLVTLGVLTRAGERRYARYRLATIGASPAPYARGDAHEYPR